MLCRPSIILSRRAVLGGAATVALSPVLTAAGRGLAAPIRLGLVEGVTLDVAAALRGCGPWAGRAFVLRRFASWAGLADHLAAPCGDLEAALLPFGHPGLDFATAALPRAEPPAARLVVGAPGVARALAARCFVVARGIVHPDGDARLRAALAGVGFAGRSLVLVAAPPPMLVANVAAGLVDAALLIGADARSFGDADHAALASISFDAADAELLDPRLALAVRPHRPFSEA